MITEYVTQTGLFLREKGYQKEKYIKKYLTRINFSTLTLNLKIRGYHYTHCETVSDTKLMLKKQSRISRGSVSI